MKQAMITKLQWLMTAVFFVAGIMLLCRPAHAATTAPTRFTITDAGSVGNPDVILIPGLASSKAVWDGEIKLLAPKYRLHIVQVAGFAGAPAGANASGPILPGIVEELHQYIVASKQHPVVIGHSLGGLLALMLADKYPTDISKMVIVDALPFYAVVFDPHVTVDAVKPQAEAMRQQMASMPDAQFAAMQPMIVSGMVKNADAQKLVAASSVSTDRTVFVNAMFEDLQTDLRSDIAKIKTPTLMIYPYDAAATKDAAAIDSIYHDAYQSMPNVKLIRIDDSRHFIMYDQPQKLDAAIEAFLK